MKKVIMVASVLALSAAPNVAWAGKYRLDLNATEPQVARMDQGREQIESELPQSRVRVMAPAGTVDPRAYIMIDVYNAGDKPFNFGPENIRLVYGAGKFSSMLTYDDLVRIEQKKSNRRAFFAALAGLGNAISASQAGDYSGSGSLYNSRLGYTSFSYSGTDYGARYMAQSQAAADNAALVAAVRAKHLAELESLENLIRTTTVDPGHGIGGMVMFGGPKPMERVKEPYPVTFEITVGSEVHRVTAVMQRR